MLLPGLLVVEEEGEEEVAGLLLLELPLPEVELQP